MTDHTAIDVRELTKRYSDGTEALRGTNFAVTPGEIFSLLGRNGSGKTTSVRIMTGLAEPTSGSVTVLGADVATRRRWVRRHIGVTLQEAAIDDVLTGREFLVLVGRFWGMRGRAARARSDDLLMLFGLSGAAGKQVRTYSGGMRRRLDIAASLVRLPRVLFLDEPTTGLDPQNRRALWSEIMRLRAEHGMTVLLTTQYLEEAEALADRIAVLDAGRVVACGGPERLRRAHGATQLRATVRGADPSTVLASYNGRASLDGTDLRVSIDASADAVDVVTQLRTAGVEVLDIEVRRDSLEDVFLALTGGDPAGTGGTLPEPAQTGVRP